MALTLRTDSLEGRVLLLRGGRRPGHLPGPRPVRGPELVPLQHDLRLDSALRLHLFGSEMALLTLWLWSGNALSPLSGLIAGALRVGAVFAACVGLVLLSFNVARLRC